MTTPDRPIMRYFGGKWRLAPWIISFFPAHRTYTESFAGAASVLLRKPRAHAEVLNDLDGEITNLFRVLRSPTDGRELIRQVWYTPFSRHEYEAAFLAAGDPIEQGRRTLVKAAMGFGSNSVHKRTGFRPGHARNGQIPAQDWAGLPSALEQVVERLRGVVIEERPAIEVIRRYDSERTLHYIDPPYPHGTRGDDCRYRYEMTDAEHVELAEVLRGVRGMAIVSGYGCYLYDQQLYADWQRIERGSHADGGRDRQEVLWIKPGAQIALRLFEDKEIS